MTSLHGQEKEREWLLREFDSVQEGSAPLQEEHIRRMLKESMNCLAGADPGFA